MDKKQLEKYSSAFTLSDMEIFVFPELMYSLVLANIMSPILWKWREEPTFKKLAGKDPYRILMRLKQYIMDEYEFNLDLETWGLTDRNTELQRFAPFISPDDISRSNALFGYHGDEYYFDVDIRRHFGLDRYNSDIIPYWKTETLEAMTAFYRKEGYRRGAGECVSLAALYAAAAFVVARIPLQDIYMILTPLHSQNFLDVRDGVLTNNRRLVTKSMWFNGTAISDKAQRALRNEQVTIVSHCSGYVHCFYDDATISADAYRKFSKLLGAYLCADFSLTMFANFLRSRSQFQKYFQACRDCHGRPQFIAAEKLFQYEHGSNYRVADETFSKLLDEIDAEEFMNYELPCRVRCDRLEALLEKYTVDLRQSEHRERLRDFFAEVIPEVDDLMEELCDFLYVQPKIPGADKQYHTVPCVCLDTEMTREQVMEKLESVRGQNTVADLAFYAYRDMSVCRWEPFVKAAVQRNPVSLEAARDMNAERVYTWLQAMGDESIYDDPCRLAQPDEVVNYSTGDGWEKAITLANVLCKSSNRSDVEIVGHSGEVVVKGSAEYRFKSFRNFHKRIQIAANGEIAIVE